MVVVAVGDAAVITAACIETFVGRETRAAETAGESSHSNQRKY